MNLLNYVSISICFIYSINTRKSNKRIFYLYGILPLLCKCLRVMFGVNKKKRSKCKKTFWSLWIQIMRFPISSWFTLLHFWTELCYPRSSVDFVVDLSNKIAVNFKITNHVAAFYRWAKPNFTLLVNKHIFIAHRFCFISCLCFKFIK